MIAQTLRSNLPRLSGVACHAEAALAKLDSRIAHMVRDASEEMSGVHPRDRLDPLWWQCRSVDTRIEAPIRVLQAFDEVLHLNGCGPRQPVCLVFDGAGTAVQERILAAQCHYQARFTGLRILLCDRGYEDPARVPNIRPFNMPVDHLSATEKLIRAVEVLSQDHVIVFNSLFHNRDAALGEPLLNALPPEMIARVARVGLYFSTEDFAAGRLAHEVHHAAQASPDHHQEVGS